MWKQIVRAARSSWLTCSGELVHCVVLAAGLQGGIARKIFFVIVADIGACHVLVLDTGDALTNFLTLHTPLTEQTRGIIDRAALAKMKRGAFLINCARGGLVVEDDVKEALVAGQLAGAAFDVFVNEPGRDNVLFGMEQVVAPPHRGAATAEAQEKVAIQIA